MHGQTRAHGSSTCRLRLNHDQTKEERLEQTLWTRVVFRAQPGRRQQRLGCGVASQHDLLAGASDGRLWGEQPVQLPVRPVLQGNGWCAHGLLPHLALVHVARGLIVVRVGRQAGNHRQHVACRTRHASTAAVAVAAP